MVKCRICNQEFSEDDFTGHPFKAHKIKLADYFTNFYKKKDLFSNEPLAFKSINQYLSSDFLNKNNLRSWVKIKSKDSVQDYCINWLRDRKELKQLKFAMTQAELKTLVFPSINYLDELFAASGGYYKICERLGYSIKHIKIDKTSILPCLFTYENLGIIKDTREGKPLIFSQASVTDTLSWGDYALSDESLSGRVRIERKSLSDAIGTLSGNYERFCREIEKAKKDDGYLVILIEEKFDNLLSFKYLPHISKKVRASVEFVTHRIRELCQSYDNIQFICVDGRREASRIIPRIFQLGSQARNIDLQLMLDLRLFT